MFFCLDYSDEVLARKNLVAAGWGRTAKERSSDHLQKLSKNFIENQLCKRKFHGKAYRNLKGTQICATGEEGYSDSCDGDSGGPLVGIGKINSNSEEPMIFQKSVLEPMDFKKFCI